jgi:hypothetical protein
MAYTGFINDVIDRATNYIRVHVTPANTDINNIPLNPKLHKFVTAHPHPGINAYVTGISPGDLQEKTYIKYDYTDEIRNGMPVLYVKNVSLKGPNGSSLPDLWSVEQITEFFAILPNCPTTKVCWLQYLMIQDLQQKINEPVTKKGEPNLLDFSEPPVDEFEAEVQRRLAKELYEQRINAEVQRRLKAMSTTTKTETSSFPENLESKNSPAKAEEGINKVFEEWKGIPIFKDIASLLKP